MKCESITMGQATYDLQRVFQGTRPISKLIAERLVQNLSTALPVDGGNAVGYNEPSGPVHRRRRT